MAIKQVIADMKDKRPAVKCGHAFKVGGEWHACHLPAGHEEPCECSHYITTDQDTLYSEPMVGAQTIQREVVYGTK